MGANQSKRRDAKVKKTIKLLPIFDGKTDVQSFIYEVQAIQIVYKISDEVMKVAVISKLSGTASTWFYSSPSHTKFGLEELLQGLRNAFNRERFEFETRKWTADESFLGYYVDKLTMGVKLNLPQNELATGIVEGMSGDELFKVAEQKKFSNPTMLLDFVLKRLMKRNNSNFANMGDVTLNSDIGDVSFKSVSATSTPLLLTPLRKQI